MSIGTSSSLTQEFTDQLSAELLYAPDSQWVFATLADAARADAMNIPDIMGRAGLAGADKAVNYGMGSIDRMTEAGRGFCKVVSEPSQAGKVILIDRPVLLGGTMTLAARTLTEGSPVDVAAPIAPTMQQVSVTLVEVAGPHNGTNVEPIGITEFLKNRSKHDLVEYIGGLLRRDRNAVVDSIIANLLLTTTNQTTPGGVATNTMTTGGDPLTEATLAQVKLNLLNRKIRPFPNGNYMLVLDPHHEKDLRADSAFREITRYLVDKGPLLSGYLTSFGGFDICISTNIPTTLVGASSNVTGYQALAFGPEAVGWAIGRDVEARRSKADDFGRQDLVIWTAIEGWQLLNANIVEKLVTS